MKLDIKHILHLIQRFRDKLQTSKSHNINTFKKKEETLQT